MPGKQPQLVDVYLRRAINYRTCADFFQSEPGAWSSAITLLCVHSAISLCDALLYYCIGQRSTSQDHTQAIPKLRQACNRLRLESDGVKHINWLIGNKNRFIYEEKLTNEDNAKRSLVEIDRCFTWVYRQFTDLKQERQA